MFWSLHREIAEHAIAEYPKESCGIIVNNEYLPHKNLASDPKMDFKIDSSVWPRHKIQAVVHSHILTEPRVVGDPPDCPSGLDMARQIGTAVPWGITLTDGQNGWQPFWFGDQCDIPPFEGRVFRHNVTDCYALVRDWFRKEKNVKLPPYPRDPGWWKLGADGPNLLMRGVKEMKAEEVKLEDIQPGDVMLFQTDGIKVPNHCGIYVGDGKILHHMYGKLSCTESVARLVNLFGHSYWRYEGAH